MLLIDYEPFQILHLFAHALPPKAMWYWLAINQDFQYVLGMGELIYQRKYLQLNYDHPSQEKSVQYGYTQDESVAIYPLFHSGEFPLLKNDWIDCIGGQGQ